MKVLFLLSCLEPAGSETYCVALARAWEGRHQVFWISDRLHFGQTYTSYPIHQKAFPGGVLNTARVLTYVRAQGIELIHSHSRRAHWVADQVAALAHIPHVTTIHQPPPVHFFSRLWPCLGDHTIAIDEAVQDHLRTSFGRGVRRISLIRNGIDVDRVPANYAAADDNRVVFIGRLSGGRWDVLKFFFSVLKRIGKTLPPTCFQIVGHLPDHRAREMESQLKEVNRAIAPSFVETHDFVKDLASLIAGCRGVVAGGRSALESLAAGKPVIALGETGVVGLCTPESWALAMRTNFGDHFAAPADQFFPPKLELGLRQLLSGDRSLAEWSRWGRAEVERHYSIKKVAQDVAAVYQDLMQKGI